MADIFKNKWIWVVIALLIAISIERACAPQTKREYVKSEPLKPTKPEKVEVIKEPYIKPIVKPNLPIAKKKVYIKKDTALRIEAENRPIIVDIEIVNGELELTKVDSVGEVTKEITPIPVYLGDGVKSIDTDSSGTEGKGKTKVGKFIQKVGQRTKQVLIVTGGVAIVGAVAVLGAPALAVVAVGVATTAVVILIIETDK